MPHVIARRTRGFTLVELLVVIAIIGILVSLLLPAINSAREAARRIQCVNNLKQVGLAVVNYESATKALPPAGLVAPGDPVSTFECGSFRPKSGLAMSWLVVILPYVEEQSLYDQFNFNDGQSVFTQVPTEPQSQTVAAYLCPSDSASGRVYIQPRHSAGKAFGKGNYAGFASPVHIDHLEDWPGALGGFKPGENKGQSIRRVKDGLSKTVVASEVRSREDQLDQRGAWALGYAGSALLSSDIHPPPGFNSNNLGETRYIPDPNFATNFPNAAQTPNKQIGIVDQLYFCGGTFQQEAQLEGMPCNNYRDCNGSTFMSASPRSRHIGGVNAVCLDGHVGFISDDVDVLAYARMISVNDGQNVNIGEFLR